MWQDIIVWIVVAAAIVVAAIWSYRRMQHPCDSCDNCPDRKKCDHPHK